MRALFAAIVLLAAPGLAETRYGEVHQPAGAKTIYIDVQHWWREILSIEPGKWTFNHIGVLAVDPTTWRARFKSGRRFSLLEAEDAAGRVYFTKHVDPDGEELWVREPGGRSRRLHAAKGAVWNITPAPTAGDPVVFFVRRSVVVRVETKTGKSTELRLPAKRHTWDWLAARDGHHVYLCGRRGGTLRTWPGDFEKEPKWGEPLDGYYQPLDARGTLIDRRDACLHQDSEDPGTTVRVIRNGKVETVDLGRRGPVHAIFGTDWVTIYDGTRHTQVIRSLKDGTERVLPKTPPLGREVVLATSAGKRTSGR